MPTLKPDVYKRQVEEDGMVDFYFLNPGKYAARLINDTNGNGEWGMIRTIVKCSFDTNYRIGSQRSFLNAFLQTFFNCREVVLRYSTTNNNLFKYIWSFQRCV